MNSQLTTAHPQGKQLIFYSLTTEQTEPGIKRSIWEIKPTEPSWGLAI